MDAQKIFGKPIEKCTRPGGEGATQAAKKMKSTWNQGGIRLTGTD